MPITPFSSPPPTRTDPATFSPRGDTFLTELLLFAAEATALEVNVNAKEASAVAASLLAISKAAEAVASAILATNNGAAQVLLAADQVTLATTQANAAAASAMTALNAPGTSATSATNLTIGVGAKSLSIQPGKAIVAGMSVKVASTASPANWMHGDVTTYDAGTGALDVSVSLTQGAGTFSAWTVSLSAPAANSSDWITKAAADSGYTAQNGDRIQVDTSGGAVTINLPAAPAVGWFIELKDAAASWGVHNLTLSRNGSTIETVADNLICRTNRDQFMLVFSGTTWRM